MSEKTSTTVTYTPLESGNEESRWIRLEQVQATLPSPSVGYMAEMLDYAFGIEACDDGLGGGGEGADESREPTEQELADMLSIIVTDASQCRQGYWLAAVNVYRTHEQPGYELRSETAKVETVEPRRESYLQVVDVNGPLIALERPYAGNLQGIPPNVNWTVRGATVNLDRPVHDRLTLRYETWHEHVTLRVPTKRTDDGEEYEAAAVVAFWGDMAAECQLEPPEPEDPENQAAIDELCRKQRPEKPEPTGCWKTVHHYKRCNCSYKTFDEWDEQVGAPCDGAPSWAQVGYEEKFDGFGWCEGEEDDYLHDVEYYKKHCCHYPPSVSHLPICRKSYRIYSGGHKIENGPEHWRAFYGENVRMIAVTPEQGYCGDEITEWNVPSKNCCDGVKPLRLDPDSAKEIIEPEHLYWVQVLDGRDGVDFRWRTFGGIKIYTGSGGVSEYENGRTVHVFFDEGACPEPGLTVNDGCSELTVTFRGPDSAPPTLGETDLALLSGQEFWLSVSGGVPGYMWMASGGIKMISWTPGGGSALFKTPDDKFSWCVGEVSVVDACGRSASVTIRNVDTGRWQLVSSEQYNACSPPVTFPGRVNEGDPSTSYTLPSGGYYARVNNTTCTYPTQDPTDRTRCGAGNDLSNQSAKWEADCMRRWPRGYQPNYENGHCWATSGSLTFHCFFSEEAQLLWRWVCDG